MKNSQDKATAKPWQVAYGTSIQNCHGQTILCACEESEGRGGTFDSIRECVAESVKAANEHDALVAVAEAANDILIMPKGSPNFHKEDLLLELKEALAALAALAAVRKGAQ